MKEKDLEKIIKRKRFAGNRMIARGFSYELFTIAIILTIVSLLYN